MDHWSAVTEHLKDLISLEDYERWIKPLTARPLNPNEAVVIVPNMLFYQVLMDKFLPLIEEVKQRLNMDGVCFHFDVEVAASIQSSQNTKNKGVTDDLPTAEPQNYALTNSLRVAPQPVDHAPEVYQPPVTPSVHTDTRQSTSPSKLNPNYTFANFVSGPSNQFAHASCAAVAENPGKTYNPLFIYGYTGLGKTHLLQAVGNRVRRINPTAVLTYITSEHFMNEMIYCLRFNKMWEFRQKYRQCDVLLVDDIQFISGNREKTQEEFFHTFNALYEAKKQIVITSDRFPQDIPDIEDRLRNRFQWGLIADIQAPDTEHRVAIILSKAEKLGIKVSSDVAFYIANHAKKNVRELEGALHRITAFAALQGRPINIELAQEIFHNVLSQSPKLLTVETIQKAVADHYKLKLSEIKSHNRQRNLTLPRQIAMYLSRELTNASFPELGERFGGKDHTTVMHAVRKINKDRLKDLDLKAHVDSLRRQLEQI